MVESLPALSPWTHIFPSRFRDESDEPRTSEILRGREAAAACAEPGPRCPGKRGTRPQHPRSGARGPWTRARAAVCQAPKLPLDRSSASRGRFSLPAGRAKGFEARRLAGAGRGPNRGGIPLPPVAASLCWSARLLPSGAWVAEPERPWPAPLVVRESAAREAPSGRPAGTPESRPLVSAGASGYPAPPPVRATLPPPAPGPPPSPPSLACPWARPRSGRCHAARPRQGVGGSGLPEPGAWAGRCASSLGLGGPQAPTPAARLPEAGICCGGAAAFFRGRASPRSQGELRKGESACTLREPSSRALVKSKLSQMHSGNALLGLTPALPGVF